MWFSLFCRSVSSYSMTQSSSCILSLTMPMVLITNSFTRPLNTSVYFRLLPPPAYVYFARKSIIIDQFQQRSLQLQQAKTMDEEPPQIEFNFMLNLTHKTSQSEEFANVIKSPNHKELLSENTENGHKIFHYHYAQNSQFQLGEGSYGRIYICFYKDEKKDKIHKLALKIISIPSSMDQIRKIDEIVAFTRQEIKSLIKLRNNPNIIKIIDVIGDTRNNRINLILEYCNNKDLDSYFTRLHNDKKIKKEEDVLVYFKQILNAFEDLYKLNIIHRDIKPENILVHNDVLKIADFGLSKQIFEKTEQFYEEHYGTFLTASPQIRFKQRYTNKCDIYSLGITLYWMVFRRFPFKNEDTQQDFMKNSLKFENDSEIKVSNQLMDLIKSMLAYKQDDRIGWNELFNHSIFNKISPTTDNTVRDTIGRDLHSEYSNSRILDIQIPKEFYQYIIGNDNFDINSISSTNFQDGPFLKKFMPIFLEIINFKYRINFFKELMREVHQFNISEKIKNKIEFAIMKDMIRLGIEKYIIFLMKRLYKQLCGQEMCIIFDRNLVNQLKKMKQFSNINKSFSRQLRIYEQSNKKPKLSEEERQTLQKRCRQYQIQQTFTLFLNGKCLREDQFTELIKKCIIEIIYFIKEEVTYYRQKIKSLAYIEQKRFRELILLIHHFYMFIMQKTIFPERYTESMNYEFQKFNEREKYQDAAAFQQLALNICQIIDRFEN